MKNSLTILTASILLTVSLLSSAATWEPRGMCYVWSGDEVPEHAPKDMLTGVIYDYNRDTKGNFFSYSGVYASDSQNPPTRSLKTAIKVRSTGAKNPTNSPDVHGQFAYTLKELINGKYSILKRFYKYPFFVAAPHIYMSPCRFSSLSSELEGSGAKNAKASPESDFISDGSSPSIGGKAKAYDDHISWFAIFRGKVIAPKSMVFRFYGAADDAIAVRFDDKLVLETGFFKPHLYRGNGMKDKGCDWDYTKEYQKEVAAGKHAEKKGYVVQKLKSTPFCNDAFNGVTGGVPIKVKKGQEYPIEIIIGNNGGGALFYLLTQEVTPENKAPLQLFRTNDAAPTLPNSFNEHSSTHYGERGPDFSKDSPVWKIVPKISGKKKSK